ncbi:MAG: NADH-quinone oxidoreductase subunit L [Thermoleophilia bacterium]|nr:NADH-quinone oxidoreductase subunit L [Thermoleophilia bacterium]
MTAAAWLALFSPLGAVAALAALGDRVGRRRSGLLVSASVLVSFASSAYVLARLLSAAPEERSHVSTLWTWLSAGDLRIGFEILVDPLSVFMMLVVSGVGFLIIAYATGYMKNDDEERRYHAYKALFVFSMLLLVQSGNLLLLLVGWGMVGLSSYLLINFWHERRSAVAAGKKAFIVNAFGDATVALGLFLVIQQVGALDFATVFGRAETELGRSSTVAVLIALGLLGGAAAKSAQVPLHTWLPDAMEGPTPVSALIHAATMVTAGVYLIARTHVLFELAPAVLHTAAVLGGVTLLAAGVIALVQTDIKRVIAYSTMSQIGYMFVAAGLGAYGAGMFHLMTHAFFKALLFMAAGLVIHALAGEQDIRRMGGLARELPRTARAFLIGTLALAGVPPLAGFFSKDEILANTLDGGALGIVLFVFGIAGAFLTALYAFRLLFVVFRGKQSDHVRDHLHREPGEGPLSMVWPVAILAVLAAIGGLVSVPGGWHAVDTWLEPAAHALVHPAGWMEAFSPILSVCVALAGIAVAWRLWGQASETPAALARRYPRVSVALERKLYFDEAYDALFTRPASRLAALLERAIERPLVAGSARATTGGVRALASRIAAAQSGLLRVYALVVAVGLATLLLVFVSVR